MLGFLWIIMCICWQCQKSLVQCRKWCRLWGAITFDILTVNTKKTGTLGKGRFKSSLVESECYFLHCQRYIELNPVRSGVVSDPADYRWSGYQCNALGKQSELCAPHREYLCLSDGKKIRMQKYRAFSNAHVEGELLNDIRKSLNKEFVLENDYFFEQMQALCNQRISKGVVGRPVLDV